MRGKAFLWADGGDISGVSCHPPLLLADLWGFLCQLYSGEKYRSARGSLLGGVGICGFSSNLHASDSCLARGSRVH
jgi:hypothetical protein